LAREAGLPVGEIVLATNANTLIGDYLSGAEWLPRASIQTLASAMDVGDPSNMERLQKLKGDANALRDVVRVFSANDQDIETEIKRTFDEYNLTICPHTATAMFTYRQLTDDQRINNDWVLVATAHAPKFESIVEPLIGASIPLPKGLSDILSRTSRFTRIEPDMRSLETQLDLHAVTGDK